MHQGSDGFDLCRREQVIIKRSVHVKRFGAYMVPNPTSGKFVFILPPPEVDDHSAREGLLIFHEAAHMYLHRDGHRLHVRITTKEVQGIVEAWCDTFALAMLCAQYGISCGIDAEPHKFLCHEDARLGDERDLFLVRRIRALCANGSKTLVEILPMLELASMLEENVNNPAP